MGSGICGGWTHGWRRERCALPLLLALSGCGNGNDDDVVPAQNEPELEFGTCPSDLPGVTEGRECATTQVPLRWDEPDGNSIELLVARYASATPHHGQLWLLDGGPGGTGAIFMLEEILPLYASLGLDVYVPRTAGQAIRRRSIAKPRTISTLAASSWSTAGATGSAAFIRSKPRAISAT